MSDVVKVVRNGQLLEITLDCQKANAIDRQTSRKLGDVFASFRDDQELRVAIFTGGGEIFFSAGWDLQEASSTGGDGYVSDYGQGGIYGFSELTGLKKPIICAVNGYASGVGFEILLCADFVVAADNARFWLPEISLGVLPDIGSFVLRSTPLSVAAVKETTRLTQHMTLEESLPPCEPASFPCSSN